MKLVEAEAEGPVEGDDEQVTPPRPPHRRVSVSLLFTASVLIGTVVTIYVVFPARHNVLMTEAIAHHGETGITADLTSPAPPELRAWLLGVIGRDVPVPNAPVLDARTIDVLNRRAALMTVRVNTDDITYLVQHARGFVPDHAERIEDGLEAVEWRVGPNACVAVGPQATSAVWLKALNAR